MPTIEVFAEIGCPFTHVGLRRFIAQRREAGRDDVDLHVRGWPLELVNGLPLDPSLVAEEVDEIRSQVAPDLFGAFDVATFPATSLPALSLAAAAYDRDAATGEAVSLELRDRLFERGDDVADLTVLGHVAEHHGLAGVDLTDSSRVQRDFEEGQARGVIGSPHFFTPGGDFFCPALEIERVDGHLRIAADPEGFDRFIRACLI